MRMPDGLPVDAARSRWEWTAAQWLRFALVAAVIVSAVVSWAGVRQTAADRRFVQSILCAGLKDHIASTGPVYPKYSVQVYERECKGVR